MTRCRNAKPSGNKEGCKGLDRDFDQLSVSGVASPRNHAFRARARVVSLPGNRLIALRRLVDGRDSPRRRLTISHVHHGTHGLPDPFRCRFDFPIPEMGVAQRHAHVRVPEQPRDDRYRHTVHHRMAGMRVAQIMKADILDARFPTDPIPERESETSRAGGIEWRWKHELAPATRLPFEDAPGLGIERSLSRSCLAIG